MDIPQLRRVIAVLGNRVAMEPTLEESIRAVLGPREREEIETFPLEPAVRPPVVPDVLGQARKHLEEAREKLAAGEWAAFGEAMDKLKDLLSRPPAPGRK
jgi:uncharacterized protein